MVQVRVSRKINREINSGELTYTYLHLTHQQVQWHFSSPKYLISVCFFLAKQLFNFPFSFTYLDDINDAKDMTLCFSSTLQTLQKGNSRRNMKNMIKTGNCSNTKNNSSIADCSSTISHETTGLHHILPERDYVTFGSLLSQFRLSSVCLSVTLVHPTQVVEPFGKISSPLCTLAILWPPSKILRR